MKRLSRHILSLLRHYDTIALPGVGFFHKRYISAEINRENSTFLPPHYDITFTETRKAEEGSDGDLEILTEDNRLLDSYIRKERVSPEEAWNLLSSDLAEFKTYISFGADPVFDVLRQLNPPLPVLHLKGLPMTVPQETTEASNVGPEEKRIPIYRNPDYYYIPIHKKVAKIAACFLLVVIVGLAALIPIGSLGTSKSTASILPISVTEETDQPPLQPSVSESYTETPEESKLPEEEFALDDEETPIPGAGSLPSSPSVKADSKEQDKYYAVVAAFKTEKEATNFIDSHKGDKSRFDIIKNSKFYLISASSAAERGELEARMPLIRADYPDVWIFALK